MRYTLSLTTFPDGSVTWKRYVLHPDQRVIIGRGFPVDIAVDGPLMSPRQASFWFENGSWMVQDADSASGTFVDDVSIGSAPAPLPPGCTLRTGGASFQVVYGFPDAPATLWPGCVTLTQGPASGLLHARLPAGAVWTVAHEDYIAFIDSWPSSAPFWPPSPGDEIYLRNATPAQMRAMLEAAEFACGRTQLGPSTFFSSMRELVRLLRADRLVRWYLQTPPPTDAEIAYELTRTRYADIVERAEARLHRVDASYRPRASVEVTLPRDLGPGCGQDCRSEAEKLDAMTAPPQGDVDRVANLLAGAIESHVVWAIRGEGSAERGEKYFAEGYPGLARVAEGFVARHRPSEPALKRLYLAILVMSEAVKWGIHFYHSVEDYKTENVTVYFYQFHDMAAAIAGT